MALILIFFFSHMTLSVFAQSLYHHRYHAHKMYTLSPFMNRALHLFAFLAQGSSYLNPRAYGILHRRHHQYSDTEKDPHSPVFHPNPAEMMLYTLKQYNACKQMVKDGALPPEKGDWVAIEKIGSNRIVMVSWGVAYSIFYFVFAPSAWFYLLLPMHYLSAPMHGFIVNYFGHKLGYRNFKTPDVSRNTLPIDIITLGELFQNNHHEDGSNPNFARKWFEWDITYSAMVVMHWLRLIRLVRNRNENSGSAKLAGQSVTHSVNA